MRGLILLFFVLLWVPMLGSPVLESPLLPLSKHTSEIRRTLNFGSAPQVCLFQINAEETEETEECEKHLLFSGSGFGQSLFQKPGFLFSVDIPCGNLSGGSPVPGPSVQILYCIFRI